MAKIHIWLSFTLFIISANIGLAQDILVKGLITDEFDEPIIGVSVSTQGKGNSTQTDLDGKYSILAPADDTLFFQFIGMEEILMPIMDRSEINIVMNSTKDNGDEYSYPVLNIDNAVFYGCDYRNVKIHGASESPTKFIKTFPLINNLFVSEYKKYIKTLSKSFGIKQIDLDLEETVNRINEIDSTQIISKLHYNNKKPMKISKIDVSKKINELKTNPDNNFGIILYALELDKVKERGHYQLVIFEMKTKEIVRNIAIEGEAGGFGLRNYWANSICSAFEGCSKLRKRININN